MALDKKPIIFGIVHGVSNSGHLHFSTGFEHEVEETPESKRIEKEKDRVWSRLKKYPKGTRVGIELTPKDFELWKKGELNTLSDLFFGMAVLCHYSGYEVVPLDSESIKMEKGTIDERTYNAKRSIFMGQEIQKHNLKISIIGDGHADDLKMVMGKTHKFYLSPHFYARKERLKDFFLRRIKPFERTRAAKIRRIQLK